MCIRIQSGRAHSDCDPAVVVAGGNRPRPAGEAAICANKPFPLVLLRQALCFHHNHDRGCLALAIAVNFHLGVDMYHLLR